MSGISAGGAPRESLTDNGLASRARPAVWPWFVALMGWSCFLCFYDLGGGAGFEPIDCWVSQTAREMRASGDYLVPHFAGETRMQKSPGPYWAVVLASLIRGTPVDEASARLPNAVAALALVALIFWLTRRIAGDRAGIFAGFATSSCVMILHWSHRGASDLGLTTFITAALACLWCASDEQPGRKRNLLWLAGYFAAGLGMLYKMPMPLACVGLPALVYVAMRNKWRLLADRIHWFGLLLFLLPWLPWAISVSLLEPTAAAKWRVEFIDRFTGDLPNVAEQRRWYFYFMYLLAPVVDCLPWSLSLIPAILRGFRSQPGTKRDGTAFLLIWYFSLLAFFTASTGKELRYFLPAVPPLLALLGIELSAFFDPQRRPRPRLDRLAASGVWVGVPAGFAAGVVVLRRWFKDYGQFGLVEWPTLLGAYLVTAAIVCAGASLAAWFYLRRRENAAFGALVAMMYAMWLWVWPAAVPSFISPLPFRDFAGQLRAPAVAELLAQDRIRHVGSQDSRIIWYGDLRMKRVIDQLRLLDMQGGRRSLEFETRLIGEEMIRNLEGPEPYLLVATRFDYVFFLENAGKELARVGRRLPQMHLWIQTRIGPPDRQFVLFGNRPPPWPEPVLTPPSDRLKAVEGEIKELLRSHAATQPTTATAPARQQTNPALSAPEIPGIGSR